ncbi:MAG TPA: hypothetical protein DCO75_05385 [Fibrobacteres bacterium]|nr:hypothetical protein [Fibrobacterota bacterium]
MQFRIITIAFAPSLKKPEKTGIWRNSGLKKNICRPHSHSFAKKGLLDYMRHVAVCKTCFKILV